MKVARTISAILLAMLVLVSSTSFMVGVHLCMGEIQNIALFADAEKCEMEQKLPSCHRHATAPCCEDEAMVHQAQDFKTSPAQPEVIATIAFDAEPTLVLISEIIPDADLPQGQFYNYDPPLRSCDLTVEYRVFLI